MGNPLVLLLDERLGQPVDSYVNGSQTWLVDVGEIDTSDGVRRYFVGVLTTGFDSSVNERANRMPWPTGQARYVLAMLAELQRDHDARAATDPLLDLRGAGVERRLQPHLVALARLDQRARDRR